MNRFGWRLAILVGCVLQITGNHLAVAQQKSQSSFVNRAISKSQPKMVKVFGASAGKVEGFATGIIVSKDGLILSSQGVFLDGRQVKVVLADGAEHIARTVACSCACDRQGGHKENILTLEELGR